MQQQKSQRILASAVIAAISSVSLMQSHASAALKTWDGGGADDSVLTAGNWDADVLPVAADTAQFDGTTRLTPFVPVAGVQYLGLNFLATATSPFTIAGPGAITLGSTTAGTYLSNLSPVTQTINAPVNMIGGTIQATSGLTFGGLFNVGNGGTAAGNAVTIGGGTATVASNITFAGGLTGSAVLNIGRNSGGNSSTPTYFGTVLASGDGSAYTGNVFINGGILRVNNATAIGTTGTVETTLTSGGSGRGTLELAGGDYTFTKAVSVRARADATVNEVSLRNVENNHTISNVTTGSGGSSFNFESAAGTLTIDNFNATASTLGRGLRLLGAGNGQINNVTTAANTVFGVIKDGTGTWTLGPNLNTTMAGTFGRAVSGTTVLGGGNAITVNGGNLVLGANLGQKVVGNTLVGNGGTLTIQSSDGTTGEVGNATPAGSVTVQQGGTIDASQFTQYNLQANQTLIGGGTFKTGGQLGTFGDSSVYVGNDAANSVGTFNVQGNLSVSNAFAPSPVGTTGFHFDLGNTTAAGASDLINVTGSLLVDNSGGPIRISVNPVNGTLSSGTYHLIQYAGGAVNASDFALSGGLSGGSRQTLALGTAAGELDLVVTGNAANLVWNGTASANTWEASAVQDWLNGGSPDRFFQGDIVNFTDAAANKTVTLVGSLQPASVTVSSSADYTFTGGGTIDGLAPIVKSGTGALTLANSGTNTFSGGVTLNAGTLNLNAPGALGTGALTINGGALGNTSGGAVVIASNNAVNLNGDVAFAGPNDLDTGTGTVTLGGTGTDRTVSVAAGTLTIGQVKSAAQGLIKQGPGTLVLTSHGASNGTLTAPNGSVIAGTLNVAAGTLQFNRTQSSIGDAFDGDLTVAAITGSGTITNGASEARWLFVTNSVDDTFAGTLANGGTGGLGLRKGGTATLTLTGTNSYTDVTTVAGGTLLINGANTGPGTNAAVTTGILALANSSALGTTSVVTETSRTGGVQLQGGISLPSTVSFVTSNDGTGAGTTGYAIDNVSGDNTINGTISLTAGGGNSIIQSDAGALTLNGNITIAAAQTSRGIVLQGVSTAANAVNGVVSDLSATSINSVTKRGTGTWALNGANTYTGATTITGGQLKVSVASRAAVVPATPAATQFLDVQGGRVMFAYADAGDDAALSGQINSTLTAGYALAPKFSTGQIRSSTLDATHLLGWADDTAHSQVIVGYTLPGDANVDLSVNFTDLLALAKNYNGTGKVWSQGDFDYSGKVDFTDLLALAKNYNQSVSPAEQAALGASFSADFALAQSLAPEPATLSAIGLGAVTLLGRRRRQAAAN